MTPRVEVVESKFHDFSKNSRIFQKSHDFSKNMHDSAAVILVFLWGLNLTHAYPPCILLRNHFLGWVIQYPPSATTLRRGTKIWPHLLDYMQNGDINIPHSHTCPRSLSCHYFGGNQNVFGNVPKCPCWAVLQFGKVHTSSVKDRTFCLPYYNSGVTIGDRNQLWMYHVARTFTAFSVRGPSTPDSATSLPHLTPENVITGCNKWQLEFCRKGPRTAWNPDVPGMIILTFHEKVLIAATLVKSIWIKLHKCWITGWI